MKKFIVSTLMTAASANPEKKSVRIKVRQYNY